MRASDSLRMHDAAKLHARRILVVEDSFLVAMDIVRALRPAGAHVLGPFAGAEAAARALEAAAPDAAILDVNLEQGTSLGLARTLTQRDIPFVFYTGYDQRTIAPEFSHVQHLQKPADLARLAEAVWQLLAL